MAGVFEHIQFQRETIIRNRRGNPYPQQKFEGNILEHSNLLKSQLHESIIKFKDDIPGYDDRLLLKLQVKRGFDGTGFESIPGFQFISQENDEVILLFATESALSEFEKRLATFGSTGVVTRKDLIEASRSIDLWSPDDRKGEILKREGIPNTELFLLDVELWPIEFSSERQIMLSSFKSWAESNSLSVLDSVSNNYLTITRIKCNKDNYEILFNHRDVRIIDIPPKYTLEYSLLQTDITTLNSPSVLTENATRVAILDSGLMSGHPLIKGAVGESRSYIDNDPTDSTGHGTAVAGIATFGNIQESITNNVFTPHAWILSGRILDDNNDYSELFIENQIEKAVREFHSEYQCKIFNLSIGDERRPYRGGRANSLPTLLDSLSHELDVLFIVSAGNLRKSQILENFKSGLKYPEYLLENSEILEPSNAINVLTVGGITRYDYSRSAARNKSDPAYQAIAQINSVSPFSRTGPGLANCIKPDLVAFAGNLGIDLRLPSILEHGLGELSLNKNFAGGNVFSEHWGTSFAAPYITHLAARTFSAINRKSILLVRNLLVSNAKIDTLNLKDSLNEEEKTRLAGYGKVDEEFLYRSSEDVVILYTSDKIQNDKNHFYEIPLPPEYFAGKRKREITITLSYFSAVRNTRVSYKATRLFFKFIKNTSLDNVIAMFDKETPKDAYKNIPEYVNNRYKSAEARGYGTVQSSTWTLKQPKNDTKFYIVVTRNDHSWGEKISKENEDYALTIILKDREQEEPRLYSRILNMIKQRVRGRS